ncbi:MAG: hypothetical protein AAFV53_04930 [Myxococcota bacterium]
MRNLFGLSLLLVGCTTDYETFSSELPVAGCDYAADCGGGLGRNPLCEDSLAASLEDLAQDADCEYREQQASQCIRELTADTCDEKTAVYYECKRTFRGEGCELDLLDILY